MKYSEQAELVEGLRALADFVEAKGIALPALRISHTCYVQVHPKNEDGSTNYSETDEPAVLAEMKEIALALKPCEKDAYGEAFYLRKKFGRHVSLNFQAERKAVCTRKQVGTEVRKVYEVVGEEEVPKYEWDCNPILA